MEREKQLIQIVLELFQEKGANFKMDDVAKALSISKKTIYKEYGNKETLILLVVQGILDGIARQIQRIMDNDDYDTLEKLIHVTCAFPDVTEIDYHKALLLKDDFPKPYKVFIDYINNNWTLTEGLFNQAVREKQIKQVDFPVFKTIMMGIIEQTLNINMENQEAHMEKCVRLVFEGLKIDS